MAEAETIHDELKHPMIAADAEEMEAGALMGRFQSRCVTPGGGCWFLSVSRRDGEFPVVFCGKIRYDGKKAGIRSGEAGMQMKGKRRIKWVYVAVEVLLLIAYLCRISGACPSLSRQPDML